MLPIELIIFDMDGVLCDTDFARRLDILGQMTSLDAKVVDDAIFQSGFDDQADRGLHTAEEYLRLFAGRLGVSLSREDWLRARGDAMTPDHAMLALVKQLQQKLPVAMLTNNGPLLQENFAAVFPEAAELFGSWAFFSSQFKATKEEPDIFYAILETLDGRAESTLFIDDSESYIASARTAGLKTHHFKGIHGLENTLRQFDLMQS
ncbi:MAG: HAD family phosphatase [Rhodospirillaceae bacterium]|jgi:putative hydrolase of the HAD superfamily|nr:HAD family phosphatase [Rhodospirillaceae bacterium]MBT4042514.1 HAD family phosphatase [Rhodospirillaceae bacterium]MBT4689630.1 HAD family phosphatase [Rhodospirillaceae bacterium]MBT5083797.1 HAD family phosphatase [Rhodospirillaceae bacterium]MBT5523004.1 HAD family phosphatase [Rhodospirillaceae bacterium]